MRVKLQLVMCSDEGQEETVTDVMGAALGSIGWKITSHKASTFLETQ